MKLASTRQAAAIAQLLQLMLLQNAEDSPFEFQAPRPVAKNWKSGTDHLQHLDLDAAWAGLGVPDARIPFMVTRIDPVGGRTTWTETGKAWLNERKPAPALGEPEHIDPYLNGEPFNLHWHQIIGVIRMLEIGFSGEVLLRLPAKVRADVYGFLGRNVILADEVGLGKTVQFIAYLCMVNWFREYYRTHKQFPGMFCEFEIIWVCRHWRKKMISRVDNRQWKNARPDGNIPDGGNIIVVPVNLHTQFTLEIQKYLEHGTFDLFPYLLGTRNRQGFWKEIWPKSVYSKQGDNRKILLATASVSDLDFPPVESHLSAFVNRPSSQIYLSACRNQKAMSWAIYGPSATRRRMLTVRSLGVGGFACSRMKDNMPESKVESPLPFTSWPAEALAASSPPLRR